MSREMNDYMTQFKFLYIPSLQCKYNNEFPFFKRKGGEGKGIKHAT